MRNLAMNVVIIFLLLSLRISQSLVDGNDVVYIGMLLKDKYLTQKYTEISDYRKMKNTGVTQAENGGFQMEYSGIYYVSSSAILYVNEPTEVRLVINVNKEPIEKSTLQSKSMEGRGLTSLQVHGLIMYNRNDPIKFYISSYNNTTTILKRSSRITFTLLAESQYQVQAFSLRLRRTAAVKKDLSRFVFTSTQTYGSFITTILFTFTDGYMVAEKDGYYFIAGNFVLQNFYKTKCTHHIYFYINEPSNSVLLANKITSRKHSVFTMNFARTLRLKIGSRIWIRLCSTCYNINLLGISTYSAIYLPRSDRKDVPVISLETQKFEEYFYKEGWTLVDLRDFTFKTSGGFLSEQIQVGTQNVKVNKKGTLLTTFTLFINTPFNVTGLKVAVTTNILPIQIDQKNLFGSSYIMLPSPSIGKTIYQTMVCFSSLLQVNENDNLRFSIYFPFQERWIILRHSSISLYYVDFLHEPKHRLIPPITLNPTPFIWHLIDSCNLSDDNMLHISHGILTSVQSGIFFVSVIVSVYGYLEQELSIALIYNHLDRVRSKQTLSAVETSINLNYTLKLASSLRINIDQTVGIYMSLPRAANAKLQCTIESKYLGYTDAIVGFQANLKHDIVFRSTGGNIKNFFNSSQAKLSQAFHFNRLKTFDYNTGIFDTPFAGLYILSANVVIRNFDIKTGSSITVAIVRNSDSKVLYFSERKAKLTLPSSEGKISLCLAGPIKLLSNDKLSLKITSNLDTYWVVDKLTSFSVVHLSDLIHGNGFVGTRQNSYIERNGKWSRVLGWTTNNPIEGQFDGITMQSPELVNNEIIMIHKNGWYVVFYRLHLKQNDNVVKNTQLGFFKLLSNKDDELIRICEVVKNPFEVMVLSCTLILYCKKEERYIFKLLADSLQSRDILYGTTKDSNVALIAVLHLLPPRQYTAATYKLRRNMDLIGHEKYILGWHIHNPLSVMDANRFSITNSLYIDLGGWHIISMKIACSKPFGNVTLTLQINGKDETWNMESISSTSGDVIEILFNGIFNLELTSNLKVKINSIGPQGEINANHTSFSITYLPNYHETLNQVLIRTSIFNLEPHKNNKIGDWHFQGQSVLKKDLTLRKPGIYIILANYIVISSATELNLDMRVNKQIQYECRYLTRTKKVLTALLAGVVVLKTSAAVLSFYAEAKDFASILPKSSISVAYLGSPDLNRPFLILKVTKKEEVWSPYKWKLVKSFIVNTNVLFYHKNNVIVPQRTGVYYLTAHVITNNRRTPFAFTVGIFINDQLMLSSSKQTNSVDTFTIAQSLSIQTGSKITIQIFSISERLSIEMGSSFCLALIEQLEHTQTTLVPVITGELLGGSDTKVTSDMDVTMNCNTIGVTENKIKYKWFKDNKIMKGHTSSVLRLIQAQKGYYQCQALINKVGSVSRVAHVEVEAINECEDRVNHCNGTNLTCIDTPTSYYCGCKYKMKYYGGQCYPNDTVFVKDLSTPNEIPVVLFIVIPFLCLTFFIIATLTICIFVKRRRERLEEDIEELPLRENAEEIALQNLSSTNNEIVEPSNSSTSGRPPDNESLGTLLSYTPSNVNDFDECEEDAGGFTEYKLKKLMKANTRV